MFNAVFAFWLAPNQLAAYCFYNRDAEFISAVASFLDHDVMIVSFSPLVPSIPCLFPGCSVVEVG